ncbi:MAG: hypothetical protein KGL16_12270 [Acidobacteriota bacterium]|nr:hypothetical protein [Acidobacteriota bacterium]
MPIFVGILKGEVSVTLMLVTPLGTRPFASADAAASAAHASNRLAATVAGSNRRMHKG